MIYPEEKSKIVLFSILGSYAVFCVSLAIISLFASISGGFWRVLCQFNEFNKSLGLTEYGHSYLKGMSRAFISIWRGDISEALVLNEYSLLVFIAMLLGVGIGAYLSVFIFLNLNKSRNYF